MTERRYRLAVDIGGTFVDAISYDERTGEITVRKAPTTPADGVITATRATNASLEEASVYTHGTTLGLNAILERKGAVTGIITNAGFRDIFEIARGDLPSGSMYDFQYRRPELLVRRRHTVGVPGRIDHRGKVVEELDHDAVINAGRLLLERGVESVAVCFLHSYANIEHEETAKSILTKAFPGGFKRSSQRLESEELRWKQGRFVGLIVRCGLRCGRLVVRRSGGVSIGSGFGRGLLVGCRARMLVWRLWLVRVGSARMAGWPHFLLSRFRDAICLLLSEKRSRFSTPATVGCVRSPASWVGHRRRSRVSCAATPQPVAEAWSIGPRTRSGIRIGAHAVRRRRSSLRTPSFASMFRIVSVALSPARMASSCQAPKCGGSVAVTGHERIDGGQARGAPSKSRTGSGSITPIMSP